MTGTPAERLRAAADLIERTATAATPGPWDPRPTTRYYVRQSETHADVCEAWGDQNAAWIALLSPDTASTLVAWLRWEVDADYEALEEGHYDAALAFADLILRGTA